MLQTNPNCNIEQDSKNSTYNIIALWTTKNGTNHEDVPMKNSHKNSDTKIEYPHPYIAELVQNMPKYRICGKKYRPIFVGELDSFDVNIWEIQI